MDQSQIGSWVEAWRVNNQIIGRTDFQVVPGTTTAPPPPPPKTTSTGTGTGTGTVTGAGGGGTNFLTGDVTLGGTQIPIWAIGLAAVAVLFMMRGK